MPATERRRSKQSVCYRNTTQASPRACQTPVPFTAAGVLRKSPPGGKQNLYNAAVQYGTELKTAGHRQHRNNINQSELYTRASKTPIQDGTLEKRSSITMQRCAPCPHPPPPLPSYS